MHNGSKNPADLHAPDKTLQGQEAIAASTGAFVRERVDPPSLPPPEDETRHQSYHDRNLFTSDSVNHPAHYNAHPSGVECIDVVEHMTFNVGSAIKYCWRAGLKDGAPLVEDLKKAIWYLEREVERVEGVRS